MTTYSVNDDGPTTINGSGSDTLIYVANHENGVDTTLSGSAAAGYSGFIDGPGSGNCTFSGILNLSITDNGVSGVVDHINTGDGSDTIHAGFGDDILYSGGGAGIDQIDGGAGNDVWGADTSAYSTAIVIDLSAGVAQAYLGSGIVQSIEAFNLTTGAGADVLTGTTAALDDVIRTGGGKDRIVLPLHGSDSVDGGGGNDTLVVVHSFDNGVDMSVSESPGGGYQGMFDGAGANNTAFSHIENFSFTDTGDGADHIRTGAGDDTLIGGLGDDVLNSGSGTDVVDGGEGLDTWGADLSALKKAVKIDLTASATQTYYGGGSVSHMEAFNVQTGSGDDVLTGTANALSDVIVTGGGNDRIILPQAGADTVIGGAGDDTLVVTHSFDNGVDMSVTADDSGYTGRFDGAGLNDLQFSEIENFSFSDTGNGADHIATGAGDDTLSGGRGDDILDSGAGKDVIDGGAGVDYWIADRSAVRAAITVDLSSGALQEIAGGGSIKSIEGLGLTTGAGDDVVVTSSITASDTIDTGAGADQITVTLAGSDSIDGGAGRDRLVVDCGATDADFSASAGPDGYSGLFDGPGANNIAFSHIEDFSITFDGRDNSVSGLNGADYLNGAAGNDSLDGAVGADTLVGGLGADQLTGGAGADVFVYQSVRDSFGKNADLITDLLNLDTIDLSQIDADTTRAGDQAFTLVVHFSGAASEAVLKYDKAADLTSLSLDVDGDGRADATIHISGNHKGFDHFVL